MCNRVLNSFHILEFTFSYSLNCNIPVIIHPFLQQHISAVSKLDRQLVSHLFQVIPVSLHNDSVHNNEVSISD